MCLTHIFSSRILGKEIVSNTLFRSQKWKSSSARSVYKNTFLYISLRNRRKFNLILTLKLNKLPILLDHNVITYHSFYNFRSFSRFDHSFNGSHSAATIKYVNNNFIKTMCALVHSFIAHAQLNLQLGC